VTRNERFCIFALSNFKIKTDNMKKIFVMTIALFGLVCLFSKCDKIEGPYYEILTNEDVNVTFPDLDPSTVYRKMLIEEFTGHRCTNCPQGHQTLENLHQQYGDTLIAVGVHFGSLAKPLGETFSYDFRTEVGNAIGAEYAIDAIPKAIVDQVFKEGGWSRDQWATVLKEVDRSTVYAAIQLINEFGNSNKTLKVNAKVTMLEDNPNPVMLAFYLVEDGIVKPQKDGNQDILDYVHNHVLRASLNGVYGASLNGGNPIPKGGSDVYAASIDMSETDWVPENCYVVAILSDQTSKKVLQVEKLDVISR
jgi:hypothetical protein